MSSNEMCRELLCLLFRFCALMRLRLPLTIKPTPYYRPPWSRNLPIARCWQLLIALRQWLTLLIGSWWWMLVGVWQSSLRRLICLAIPLLCCRPLPMVVLWPHKEISTVISIVSALNQIWFLHLEYCDIIWCNITDVSRNSRWRGVIIISPCCFP